jgi:hypothetical protein
MPLLIGWLGFPVLALAALPFRSCRTLALGIIHRVLQLALIAVVGLLAVCQLMPVSSLAVAFEPLLVQFRSELPGFEFMEGIVGPWLLLAFVVVFLGMPNLVLLKKLRDIKPPGPGARKVRKTRLPDPAEIPHPAHRPLLVKDVMDYLPVL